MINMDEPETIRFRPEDQPELPEIDQQVINAEREDRERRKEERRRWLEEHCDWQPHGDVW